MAFLDKCSTSCLAASSPFHTTYVIFSFFSSLCTGFPSTSVVLIDPGFAGQAFIDETLEKIKEAKEWKEKYGYHYEIAVDGCCNEKYYKQLYDVGTEVFILGGSGLFSKSKDTKEAIAIAKNYIEEATK